MPAKNLIVVVVDRLHAGMIGAYGNSWIHTRRIDRLASEGFVFDQAFLQNPDLAAFYRACWLDGDAGFPALVTQAGWRTNLLTDDPVVLSLPGGHDFAATKLVEYDWPTQLAESPDDTALAKVFQSASQWLAGNSSRPFCLWVHARGMAGPWDAPKPLRDSYADADDPEPPALVDPPDYQLGAEFDPDELLGVVHAYAGQVALLDRCVGSLVDELVARELYESTAVVLMSPRGFPLGEHQRVGPGDEPLHNELTQLVWLARFPDGVGRLARSQALVEPSDLTGTLLEWLSDGAAQFQAERTSLMKIVRGEQEKIRDAVAMQSQHDRALRTPAWLLRQPEAAPVELYAKPSDRWEVNEIAKLCPEIVAGLQAVLAQVSEMGTSEATHGLPSELVVTVD